MNHMPHRCGVYKITATHSGEFYIGSAKDMYVRWRDHQSALRGGYHHNTRLQRIANKHGIETLVCEVVEFTQAPMRVVCEQWYLDNWSPALNEAPRANGGFSGTHTEEAKQKMREARKNQGPPSEETRRKISEVKLGH